MLRFVWPPHSGPFQLGQMEVVTLLWEILLLKANRNWTWFCSFILGNIFVALAGLELALLPGWP